jgi:hypothetical protein
MSGWRPLKLTMPGNSLWLVKETCPTCHNQVEEELLRRPDGMFMDPTIYCETCNELVQVTDQATTRKIKDFNPEPQGAPDGGD